VRQGRRAGELDGCRSRYCSAHQELEAKAWIAGDRRVAPAQVVRRQAGGESHHLQSIIFDLLGIAVILASDKEDRISPSSAHASGGSIARKVRLYLRPAVIKRLLQNFQGDRVEIGGFDKESRLHVRSPSSSQTKGPLTSAAPVQAQF
jgi:hypothetical protein